MLKDDDQLKKAYVKYASEHIKKNMAILNEKSVYDFDLFITSPKNFQIFFEHGEKDFSKNLYNAFYREIASRLDTLNLIHSKFKIPYSYNVFISLLNQSDQELIKFHPDFQEASSNVKKLDQIKSGDKNYLPLKYFDVIPQNIKPANSADRFYDGYPPNWNEIAANFDFVRSEYANDAGIKNIIQTKLKNIRNIEFLIITGVAGTGKTTFIKRVAFDVSRFYKNVFYLDFDNDENYNELYSEISGIIKSDLNTPTVFILNGIGGLIKPVNSLKLEHIVNQFYASKTLFIVGEHSSVIHDLDKAGKLPAIHLRTILTLAPLDNVEISRVIVKLESLEAEGKLAKLELEHPRNEIMTMCSEEYKRHMVVILMQLRQGRRFEDIIINESRTLERLDQFSFDAYRVVCLFSILGVSLDGELLINLFDAKFHDGYQSLNKYCKGILLEKKRRYLPRHSLIGKIIFEHYYQGDNSLILKLMRQIIDVSDNPVLSFDDWKSFISKVFQVDKLFQKLKRLFDNDLESVCEFYSLFRNLMLTNKQFRIDYLNSLGMFEASVSKFWNAIEAYTDLKNIQDTYYVQIMLSKLYLNVNEAKLSAQHSREAFNLAKEIEKNKSKVEELQIKAAYNLSYSTYDYYIESESLFLHLSKSSNKVVSKECVKYFEHLNQFRKVVVSKNKKINNFILKAIRPRLVHFDDIPNGLTNVVVINDLLSRQQDYFYSDLKKLKSIEKDFENCDDNNLKSIYYRMLALSLRKLLYIGEQSVELEQIESAFNKSIEFNQSDPFNYNFYGSFLREQRKDINKAEAYCRKAIEVGDRADNPFFHRHHKLLNDLGYLLLAKIELGDNNDYIIKEARELFNEAIAAANKRNIQYNYPKKNLIRLKKYIIT